MRVALIADIHGNLAALDATLEALQGESIDMVVCLGDVAATGPEPCAVLDRLRELACPTVMGNADAEFLADPPDLEELDDDSRKIAEISAWASAQFNEDDRGFLSAFQPTLTIDLGSAGLLLCCHGSPRSYDDVIRASTPDEELDLLLADMDAQIIAGGHTHTRMLRHWRGHGGDQPWQRRPGLRPSPGRQRACASLGRVRHPHRRRQCGQHRLPPRPLRHRGHRAGHDGERHAAR